MQARLVPLPPGGFVMTMVMMMMLMMMMMQKMMMMILDLKENYGTLLLVRTVSVSGDMMVYS